MQCNNMLTFLFLLLLLPETFVTSSELQYLIFVIIWPICSILPDSWIIYCKITSNVSFRPLQFRSQLLLAPFIFNKFSFLDLLYLVHVFWLALLFLKIHLVHPLLFLLIVRLSMYSQCIFSAYLLFYYWAKCGKNNLKK